MNIGEYISSGIVEACVLGLASPEEQGEFDRMCAAHFEVRQARDEFALSLEREALRNALSPKGVTKSKIFSEIDVDISQAANGSGAVFTLDQPARVTPPSNFGWQRYLAAASVILLLGSTAMNLYLFNRYRVYSQKYDELLAQQSELAANNQSMQTQLREYENSMGLLKNPNMVMVRMPGSQAPASPDSSSNATVFWDSNNKEVYLLVNNLPPATPGKQYQLWAIIDGKPVDAGVFDQRSPNGMVKMKNIQKADVFAITLEKQGGATSPEGPIYVLGKV